MHQGKGATHADARLGALLEAVESDAAERFDAEGPKASWHALDTALRPRHLDDFLKARSGDQDLGAAIRWVMAERVDGSDLAVPFSSVSLDFTIDKDSRFERASAGVATGSTIEEAKRSSLLELIERDAVSRFHASDYFERLECELAPESVRAHWFQQLDDRIGSTGLALRLFALPSPTGLPVFAAAITDRGKNARPYAGTAGYAAHFDPEIALFQAIAEALQSRLTFISGAREDCWPHLYTTEAKGMTSALAPPPVSGIDAISFDTIGPGPSDFPAIAETLANMGCDDIAFVTLATPHDFYVVRGFAPGLGSLSKAPRL